MCLILIAWQAHPDYPLVVAANRDEFHARPAAPAAAWQDADAPEPPIVGGRDLEAGGTWLGLRGQRFAAVTNVREPGRPAGPRSRGDLTRHFLASDAPTARWLEQLQPDDYSGFNLLCSDGDSLYYASNRIAAPQRLAAGIYGLSNHLLDTPWPKLETAKAKFSAALATLPATAELFALLADREIVPDPLLPATGVSLEWERQLSAIFVCSPTYGTRAASVVLRPRQGPTQLHEQSFASDGSPAGYAQISTGV